MVRRQGQRPRQSSRTGPIAGGRLAADPVGNPAALFPNSSLALWSLPPSKGEVRWGVGGHVCLPTLSNTPITHPPTVSHRTPTLSPTPATLAPEQECHLMPLSPQPRRRAPHAAGNHALDKGDQRLTKVDKTCHCQPPSKSQIPAKHRKAANPTTSPTPSSTLAVNLSGASRTNLNNPEQIRTNPNTAEHPDQIGPPSGSPLNTPKTKPEQRRRTLAASYPPLNPPPQRGWEV